MWRSLWRSIDRFSVHYFRYIANELKEIKVVDKHNKEIVVDLLQSIAEIVTYGDRHDPSIFECFMEFQVLAEFVRILKIGANSGIEAPLLQYLSIMIQNMENEHAIYYCLSNGYINSIISHQYEFDGGDLIPYYVSFLRAVSGKIDRDTICLLVKLHQDAVVSFPLYVEALKFAHHDEKMIQIAVRALTLNIYNVADEMVYQFVTTPPVSEYFSSLILNLKNKCFHVDSLTNGVKEDDHERKRELLLETDSIVDDFYYLKDILCIPQHCLSRLVTENIANLLIFPMLVATFHDKKSNDADLSAVTCLYVLSRLLQVFDGTNLVNIVVQYQEKEELVNLQHGGKGNVMMNYLLERSSENSDLSSHFGSLPLDNTEDERGGILGCIFSCNHSLMLAALMLLFVVAESKDLHHHLATKIGLSQGKTSYELSCGHLCEEFDRCWFDYIPDMIRNEWANCKTALKESSQSKDPFFLLELASSQISPKGGMGPAFDWQRMVDCVKVFVLHLQLKPFIFGGDPFENPLANLKNSSLSQPEKRYASDLSLAGFGSEVALGSGIACKIAFSGAGTRDIYVIPIAREISGKLLLIEQHPLHSRRGVVIAIAPLAGLNPKIDENHPTWLHLQLRDFEPRLHSGETRRLVSGTSVPAQGRWILGFLSAKDCEAAFSVILEEIRKQRSFVKNLVAPLLDNNFFGNC